MKQGFIMTAQASPSQHTPKQLVTGSIALSSLMLAQIIALGVYGYTFMNWFPISMAAFSFTAVVFAYKMYAYTEKVLPQRATPTSVNIVQYIYYVISCVAGYVMYTNGSEISGTLVIFMMTTSFFFAKVGNKLFLKIGESIKSAEAQ
jgi:hypothetical protein